MVLNILEIASVLSFATPLQDFVEGLGYVASSDLADRLLTAFENWLPKLVVFIVYGMFCFDTRIQFILLG